MLPMVLAAADQALLATAVPSIAAELGDLQLSAWLSIGYLLAMTITVPMYGRMGDRWGRRRALGLALVVFAVGSLACSLATRMDGLVAMRILQGLGGGGLMVLSQAIVGEVVAPPDRPRIQGYLAVNFVLASIAGPLVGGVVVTHLSWRWLFGANVPLALLALWQLQRMTRLQPPPPPPDTPGQSRLDIAGLLLFSAACTASLAWTSFGGHRFAWWSTASLVLVLVSAALWLGVVIAERHAQQPFLPVELFHMREVRATAGTVVAMAGGLFALVFLLPLYLQLGHGVHASQAAVLLMPLMIGIVSGSTLTARWLARRQVAGVLPKYGLGLAALAMAAQAVLEPGLRGTALLCGLAGCGLGTVMPNAQILVQILAGPARLAIAAAAISLARAVGAAIGTALFSALFFALLYGVGVTSVTNGDVDMPTSAHVLHAGPYAFGSLALWFALGCLAACRITSVPLRGAGMTAQGEA